jgi:hypothetical protein
MEGTATSGTAWRTAMNDTAMNDYEKLIRDEKLMRDAQLGAA